MIRSNLAFGHRGTLIKVLDATLNQAPDVFSDVVIGDGEDEWILRRLEEADQNLQQFVVLIVQFFCYWKE